MIKVSEMKVARVKLGLSQATLAKSSRVPRWKISLSEQGLAVLSKSERAAIASSLGIECSLIPTVVETKVTQSHGGQK